MRRRSAPLRLGFIGLGGIGYSSLRLCLDDDLFCPVAGADTSAEMRDRAAELLPAEVIFEDYRQMIRRVPMDCVFIATPNCFHAPAAIAAMRAGLDVCCEKPMADTLAAAKRILAVSRETKRLFMVAQNQRFRADTQWLKQRIDAGLLGEVYAVHTRWVRRTSLTGDRWFRYKALSGGGPLIDLGVHVMDLALWLIGFPRPRRVSGAWGQYFCPGDTEDWAYGTVRLEGGAILTCEVAEQAHLEREKIQVEIRGARAGVLIDGHTGTTIYRAEHGAPADEEPILDADWVGSRRRELRHFGESVISGRPTIIPPEQSVQIMAIIDGLYRSGVSGKEVALGEV